MIRFIIREKLILFALIVGLVYILPHILFIFEQGKDYHLFFQTYEQGQFYAARVREIYDGNYLSSDPYIYENKTKPYIRPFLSEYIVGTLGKISGLSINNIFILGDFIFPIIIFCLLFYFLNLLTCSPSLSLVGSMVIMLAEVPDSLTALVKLNFPNCFLTFSRYISPQFHYIFFISCLIFIYRSLVNYKIVNILLSGFFLGLLFYVYPYFWFYIFVGLAVLFLYFLSKRQCRQIKVILFILIEALSFSIPLWINHLKLTNISFYNEIMTRIAFKASHHIIISKVSILSLLIFIAFYKKRDFNFFFLFSFLLSGLLCMNQQVLTGWIFEPDCWHLYVNKQIAVISGIVLLNKLLRKTSFRERFIRIFLISGLSFSIFVGMIIQIYNYEENRQIQGQQQHLYKAFVWLQDNSKKEDVILACGTISMLIPIHTYNNIYWSSYIFDYANSDKDILERFFLLARLFGLDEGEIIDYILTRRGKGHNDFFGIRYEEPSYRKTRHAVKVNLPKDLYDYIIQRYRAFKKEDVKVALMRFRADYLFYSRYEQLISKGRFKKQPFLDKVYDSGDIQIYKILKIKQKN